MICDKKCKIHLNKKGNGEDKNSNISEKVSEEICPLTQEFANAELNTELQNTHEVSDHQIKSGHKSDTDLQIVENFSNGEITPKEIVKIQNFAEKVLECQNIESEYTDPALLPGFYITNNRDLKRIELEECLLRLPPGIK